MTRYLIDFSYSGANFSGYQKQPGKRTVQDEIEKVLSSINNNSVKLTSSGRTGALVNAIHQKAHFDLDKKIGAYKLNGALNSYLPDDIYVNSVTKVDNLFHARYMVKSKTYEYLINTGDYNPLLRTHVYQYCKPLNIRKMKEAVKYFIGKHDFTTFVSAEDKKEDKVRDYICDNLYTECAYYEEIDKLVVINNSGDTQKTVIKTAKGDVTVELAPFATKIL